MITISIPSRPIHRAANDEPAGPVLAELLREIADRLETDVQWVPYAEDNPEWKPETYRVAKTINGVLTGAVVEIHAINH